MLIDIKSGVELTLGSDASAPALVLETGRTLRLVSDPGGGPAGLSLAGPLKLAGGTLDITADLSLSGDIELAAGAPSTVSLAPGSEVVHNGGALRIPEGAELSMSGEIPFQIELAGGTLEIPEDHNATLEKSPILTASSVVSLIDSTLDCPGVDVPAGRTFMVEGGELKVGGT